jgi:putrescine transport system permease protein
MEVFSSVRMGVSPKVNALSALLVTAIASLTFVGWWLMRRQEHKRLADLRAAKRQ